MSAWAKPGAECVCINGTWSDNAWYGWEFLPQVGVRYTVRETLVIDGQDGIRLVEITNPKSDYAFGFIEPAFATARFRPVASNHRDALAEEFA